MPIDDVRPGMVGIGRTVFAGEALEEFRANIIGVLKNVNGPKRDLILARLEGGPLANTGVIQGMSGSPVYIDGRLVGAVSYSLGSFPKEPLAGITPIAEMTADVDAGGSRAPLGRLAVSWPAEATDVFAALGRVIDRAASPLGGPLGDFRVVGPLSLAELAPTLRPIGAAMVLNGFDPTVDRDLRHALAPAGLREQTARPVDRSGLSALASTLRPGDPVGMSLVRGDLEMGATGTVTHVDGTRVYAFGHPFLNLGSSQLAMTKAHVFTVLPSLDSSMKIASMGPVIGTMNQDRATAVGGTLGAGPRELEVNIRLESDRAPERRFQFFVLQDPALTPLFAYVSVLNALIAYERQTGVLSVNATGTLSFGRDGTVTIDDTFSGDTAVTGAAGALSAAVGVAMTNDLKAVVPEKLDVNLRVSERQQSTTIERVWLDTIKPRFGGTHTLQILLRDYRGARRTVTMPITMPTHAEGPLTLLVCDAAGLTALEQRDLKPGRPTSWPELLAELNAVRRNNRLYARLIGASTGTVVGGETLSALPASVRSVLDSDATVARVPVSKAVLGAWEQRLDLPVRGSRELTLTLSSRP
jgi:hypothetical protein